MVKPSLLDKFVYRDKKEIDHLRERDLFEFPALYYLFQAI
jgi:hypothetical protein